jgi:hypothetical protein
MEQIEDFICNFCGKVCKNANSLRNHERLCKLNPQRQLTTYEKYGAIPGFNDIGHKSWNKGQTAETNASIAIIQQKLKDKYQAGELVIPQPMADPEIRAKHKAAMKKAYSNYTRRTPGKFKYGWYKGVWCDSSWELAYLLYCQNNNINVVRNTFGFSYIWQGSVHKYFPDFYLPDEGIYIEIKGHKTERDIAKITQFTAKLLVLEAVEMKPILKEVETVFGKQFTSLYDQNNMVP